MTLVHHRSPQHPWLESWRRVARVALMDRPLCRGLCSHAAARELALSLHGVLDAMAFRALSVSRLPRPSAPFSNCPGRPNVPQSHQPPFKLFPYVPSQHLLSIGSFSDAARHVPTSRFLCCLCPSQRVLLYALSDPCYSASTRLDYSRSFSFTLSFSTCSPSMDIFINSSNPITVYHTASQGRALRVLFQVLTNKNRAILW